MNKYIKLVVLISIAVLSVYLSYRIAYYICETYFFDKVFYQKSVEFGYWIPGKKLLISDFGRRAYDVIPLFNASFVSRIPDWYRASVSDKALEHVFTVAIIGDSYVWGQGVHFSDSVSQVLERKLNTIRKTKVFAFAEEGDDVVENYSKYVYLQDKHIDLFVFVIVNNDVMLNIERKYSSDGDLKIYTTINDGCVRANNQETTGIYFSDQKKGYRYYDQKIHESYANSANICVLNTVASLLPKEKAIYFDPDNYFTVQDKGMDVYLSALRQNNLYILSSAKGRSLTEYAPYFRDPEKYFHVSQLEDHPSVLAHRMYADILFREITTNPRWELMQRK